MAYDIPILLVVFKRPDVTAQLMERIRAVQPRRLYISADGPRPNKAGEAEAVAATRAVLEAVDWPCTVKRLYRDENLGCRRAVSGGIDWFFEQEERGIILEEDCIPDLSFFPWVAELLERYADAPDVMAICGWNWLHRTTEQRVTEDYWFTRFNVFCGWATWRRAWARMDVDMPALAEFKAQNQLAEVLPDPLARQYLLQKFQETHDKVNHSWAYAWMFSCLLHRGLTILPRQNLIENIGFGDAATHTEKPLKAFTVKASAVAFPLTHPQAVAAHPSDWAQQLFYAGHKTYFLLRVNRWLPKSLIRRVAGWLGK